MYSYLIFAHFESLNNLVVNLPSYESPLDKKVGKNMNG